MPQRQNPGVELTASHISEGGTLDAINDDRKTLNIREIHLEIVSIREVSLSLSPDISEVQFHHPLNSRSYQSNVPSGVTSSMYTPSDTVDAIPRGPKTGVLFFQDATRSLFLFRNRCSRLEPDRNSFPCYVSVSMQPNKWLENSNLGSVRLVRVPVSREKVNCPVQGSPGRGTQDKPGTRACGTRIRPQRWLAPTATYLAG